MAWLTLRPNIINLLKAIQTNNYIPKVKINEWNTEGIVEQKEKFLMLLSYLKERKVYRNRIDHDKASFRDYNYNEFTRYFIDANNLFRSISSSQDSRLASRQSNISNLIEYLMV